MKHFLIVSVLVFAFCGSYGQQEIAIYDGPAPGSENWKQPETSNIIRTVDGQTSIWYTNVVKPTITVFTPLPGKSNGVAMVVCPGGAYMGLAWDIEGTKVAKWLTARRITAFILQYRTMPLPGDSAERSKAMIATMTRVMSMGDFLKAAQVLEPYRQMAVADGKQAIKYIRAHAGEWSLQADKIGIIGFSAGAGLVLGVIRDHDSASRPNFAASLYGFDFDQQKPLPSDAPPLFIAATQEDHTVPVQQSTIIFEEWTKSKVPCEMHLYEKGPHGFGISHLGLPVDHWTEAFESWLRSRKLINFRQTGTAAHN